MELIKRSLTILNLAGQVPEMYDDFLVNILSDTRNTKFMPTFLINEDNFGVCDGIELFIANFATNNLAIRL